MWFFAFEVLLIAVIATTAGIVLLAAWRDTQRQPALWLGAILLAAAGLLITFLSQAAGLLRDVDFLLGLSARTAMIEHGYSNREFLRTSSGAYFFLRVTGFSPDPYCGYEYVPSGAAIDVDPRGSGGGIAEPLGIPGWFWICAR